jgi:hypothetical protein
MHRSLGYLQTLGKRTAGHAAMGLQQQKRGEQPVGLQNVTSFLSFYFLNMTSLVINEFLFSSL